jgi:hypothetical protein
MKKTDKPIKPEDPWQKAKNWTREDWEKFHQFRGKLQKEADEFFGTDEDFNSIVQVDLINSAFHRPSRQLPVTRETLLKTDEDWRRAIDISMCNVNSSSESLSTIIRCWNFEQDYKQGIEILRVAADNHCREVLKIEGGCSISYGYGDSWPVLGEGRVWYAEKWSTEDNDYKGRTLSFNPNAAKFDKGLNGVTEFISRRVKAIMESIKVDFPYSVMLVLNDGSLRAYCEIDRSWSPGGVK